MASVIQRIALTLFGVPPLALLVYWRDLGPDTMWICALVVFTVASPALLILLEFCLLWQQQDQSRRTRRRAAVIARLWVSETLVAAKCFLWDQALREFRFRTEHKNGSSPRGVVLVHGYLCNRGFWNPWIPQLEAANISYVCISLEPVFGSIDDSAGQIAAAVRRSTELTGVPPVVVTHSMGGLGVRAAMRFHGDHMKVHHVVTIACPHQGTALAMWGMHQKEKEMRPGSAWLRDLKLSEPPERRAKFTCFYGDCDNVVFPPELATLTGADNRLISQRAHLQMANSPEVFAEVLRRVHT